MGEAPFQVLTNNFSISPSNEGYTLQISADGENYSNLFQVGANVTRLVTGVAANSYYRLLGNNSEVAINWMKTCVTEGGGGTTYTAGQYIDIAEDVISVTGITPDDYITSAYTGFTPIADFNALSGIVQEQQTVFSSGYNELHTQVLELSARTVDLSPYTPTSGFSTINGSAITNGGNLVIEADVDLSDYWTSAQTQTYVDSAVTILQGQIDTIDTVIPAAIVDINDRMVSSSSVDTIWKGSQAQYDALTNSGATADPSTFYIII